MNITVMMTSLSAVVGNMNPGGIDQITPNRAIKTYIAVSQRRSSSGPRGRRRNARCTLRRTAMIVSAAAYQAAVARGPESANAAKATMAAMNALPSSGTTDTRHISSTCCVRTRWFRTAGSMDRTLMGPGA
jgi:hypothetical protein